ncbi:MAG: enoyl-CoA hydratase/isomerase family protein, partial [Casimicrobiaceae bacterium]
MNTEHTPAASEQADAAPVLLLEHERSDRIATLRLNRPQALNALDDVMMSALVDAVRAVVAETRRRVLIIEGAGNHFMAGGDIKGFAKTLEL